MKREEYIRMVDLYFKDIYRFAYSGCNKKEDAEDITQEVFEALFYCTKEFENEEHVRRWLLRVAYNKCKSLWRSLWKTRVDFRADACGMEEAVPVGFEDERQEKLWEALGTLSSGYSQVVHLFYYQNMQIKEIAQVLGISETAVTTRLNRAREKLRKRMENGYEEF